MTVLGASILAGASGNQGGYNLTKSLRFRSSASAYLQRSFTGSQTNANLATISAWVKRGALNVYSQVAGGVNDAATIGRYFCAFRVGDTAQFGLGNDGNYLETTQVFRDPSAWYHIMAAYDSTQATASNRVKIYVNGVQVTAFSTANYPAQNTAFALFRSTNSNNRIADQGNGGQNFDGYLAEFNFIDGQALTPSSFGETSSTTGVWIPKRYTGTYGNWGFYLPFTDVATTSGSNAGLGKDFSGNGNYWTTNNISVTTGTTYDSMSDVPTLTNATTANYCVMNPIALGTTTLSDGNLKAVLSTTTSTTYSTVGVTTGKWYWEVTYLASFSNALSVGVNQMGNITTLGGSAGPLGTGGVGYYGFNGNKYVNGTGSSYGATFTTNDVIGVALDATGGTITFYKNNTSQGTISLPTLTSSWDAVFDNGSGGGTQTMAVNFGQQPFAYTPPTGFVALNTFNLSTPTIGATASSQASKYMDATLYTGTGTTPQNIVNAGSFQPDFVWIKSRSNTYYNELFDVIRGVNKPLFSNDTLAEANRTGMTAFNSNGFTVQDNGTTNQGTNAPGATFVGWQWKANGSGSTNTAGSITSTVSANTTAGFSIVTYTGTGSNATVGHGLGVAPSMIIVKKRSAADSWQVYHASLTSAAYRLVLNDTAAQTLTPTIWNSTAPTSTVFSIGTDSGVNTNTGTYVAYCFAQVAGYSAFGSYTGNGSSDGTFVFTGFRPRYIMIKPTNVSGEYWQIIDTARNPYNASPANMLSANLSAAEAGIASQTTDILSNGFKFRGAGGGTNGSGTTYIYMAFAESPFKYANAR